MTVGLSKADGRPWDGPTSGLQPEDASAITMALGASEPFVGVSAILARPTIAALDKPELEGQATLYVRASPLPSQPFRGQRDSVRPMLLPQPGWSHVPLDGTALIQVDVIDEDLVANDPVGTFVISPQAIDTAARLGTVYQFKVADQTGATVLFVGVMAIPEAYAQQAAL